MTYRQRNDEKTDRQVKREIPGRPRKMVSEDTGEV